MPKETITTDFPPDTGEQHPELKKLVDEFCNGMFTGHADLYRIDLLNLLDEAYERGWTDAKQHN